VESGNTTALVLSSILNTILKLHSITKLRKVFTSCSFNIILCFPIFLNVNKPAVNFCTIVSLCNIQPILIIISKLCNHDCDGKNAIFMKTAVAVRVNNSAGLLYSGDPCFS